ncbi:MAG: hypothetical protein WCT11_00720 [Candidatus Magasanikbacteria bacterium]
MDKKLSEHIYFALVITDFDYISVRHLMAGALFPSAGALANVVIDRYIKIALMSAGRNDLIDVIKKWRGNKSHNVPEIMKLYKNEVGAIIELTVAEQNILDNIYKCYCFRYVDEMFKTKGSCEIRMADMHTIDKVVSFFRNKIELISPHLGNTIIDVLLKGDPQAVSALSTGNVDLRSVFLFDNPYFSDVSSASVH